MKTRLYENLKVLQAPMCATTDLPFRLLTRKMGLPFAFTEMLTARPLTMKCEKTFEYLQTTEEDRPLGTQVLGRDPDLMAEAFSILESMQLFDVIDINMGCPVRKVVSKGMGSALMREPKAFEKMLSKVTRTVKIPVTVKFRTGWDFENRNAVEIAKIAEASGAQAVTVHGRTCAQMYSGEIDFDTIRAVKENVSIPVIGNGNLFSKQDVDEMLEKTGCDLVMISRGSNGNPWIFQDIESGKEGHASKYLAKVRETALEHGRLVFRHHPPSKAPYLSRRVGSFYFKGFVDNAEYKRKINQVKSLEDYVSVIETYTAKLESMGITTAQTLKKEGHMSLLF